MRDEIAKLLYAGAQAIHEGRLSEAHTLLQRVLERDERNEQAWLWFSGAVTDPCEQLSALERVVSINPDNVVALSGIACLRAQLATTGVSKAVWEPPTPRPLDLIEAFACHQCGNAIYSAARYCWQCHAPVRSCGNCVYVAETRCKDLQNLCSPAAQSACNTCPWWRPTE